MGTEITKLLPEVQLRVNSNPDKYDPNGNGQIDDGEELSTLLSEYGKKYKDSLISGSFDDIFTPGKLTTYEEKNEIDKTKWKQYTNSFTKGLFANAEVAVGAAGIIAFFASAPEIAAICGGVALVSHLINRGVAKRDAFNIIKERQANKAEDIRQEKRAKEEEMRQREAALNQQELEYQKGMDEATKNIERQVSSAQRKANKLNADLKEVQAQVDSLAVK